PRPGDRRMKLRREKRPAIQPEHGEYMADVAVALRDAVAVHRALPAEREALLEPARRAAMLGRAMTWYAEGMAAGLPEQLQPFAAVGVLTRVAYSLVAHAQSPPDPRGALDAEQVDALFDDQLREWLDFCLRGVERAGAR